MTTGDDRVLADVRRMWHEVDPPPTDLVERMIAAVASADLDLDIELELMQLVRDSATEAPAGVRGGATVRVLHFAGLHGWVLETEIDADRVRGQLLDFPGDLASVEVVVETAEGGEWTTRLDEVGFFVLDTRVAGSVRFGVRHEDSGSISSWVRLQGSRSAPGQE
ncbi:hypothetical protein EXE58_00755 [Nocardioides seonyuensis]|uniref:Uncharacterized protein n=1 Tax=Nocardioides seonyuensis TaxID=2518371 RepID=A0A4P7IAW2_9ACTN|nr:hypothetical protein [Nocardioides seonyuensis]QBX54145.1 hypothetical protein EXE58_00755 [Nocardioides seonyuensis]